MRRVTMPWSRLLGSIMATMLTLTTMNRPSTGWSTRLVNDLSHISSELTSLSKVNFEKYIIHNNTKTKKVNWSSSLHQGEIHRVKSDGTNRTEFAPAAILGSPVGLALDWMTENLYYTNPATQSIEVRLIILCQLVVFSSQLRQMFSCDCTSKKKITTQRCCSIIAPVCVWPGFEVERGGAVQENSHH